MKPLLVGTRGSALALAQVDLTRAALAAVLPDLPVVQKIFVTRGDQKLDLSLLRANEAGGKGTQASTIYFNLRYTLPGSMPKF